MGKKKKTSAKKKKEDLKFFMKATRYSPRVEFDNKNNILEIKGISNLKDPENFYIPLIEWITKNWNRIKKGFIIEMEFNFFNTQSSRELYELFEKLRDTKNIKKKHKVITIHWIYSPGDNDLKESGRMYSEMFPDLFFVILEKKKEED